MMKRVLSCIVIFSFLSACTAQKAYEGQIRNSNELSVISPASPSLFKMGPAIAIKEVDGVKLDRTKSGAFEVLPGTHSIQVFLVQIAGAFGGDAWRSYPIQMTFKTEAGKKYIVDYAFLGDQTVFFILCDEHVITRLVIKNLDKEFILPVPAMPY